MTVRVTGNTFDHRELLKQLGGRWDAAAKNWVFEYPRPKDIAELKNLPGCLVVDAADEPTPAAEETDEPRETDETYGGIIDRLMSRVSEDKAAERKGTTEFYGDSQQYFNHFKDKNPTSHMEFSTLGRFVDWIEEIPERVKNDHRRNSAWEEASGSFSGVRNMKDAIDLARNGWQEGIDNAAKVAEMLTAGNALQRRRAYSVAGGNVSVGRLLSGNPSHMVRRPKLPGRRVITVFVQNNGLADIKASSMIARSAICCAVIDLIEQNGFSCELVSVTTDYMTPGVPGEHLVVKLKSAGEKLNLPDVAFALGHPAFFRRFGFAAIAQAEELREQWRNFGYSTEAFNSKHQPGKNEFYIPHLKQNPKGNDLEEMTRNLLPVLLPKNLPLEIK